MNRYLAAAMIAGLVSAAALAYGTYVRADFYKGLRESFRQSKAEGAPDLANVDVETMQLSDFGIELSKKDIRRIQLADFIQGAWFVWIPVIFVLCFGVAYLWSRSSRSSVHVQAPEVPEVATEEERRRLYETARDALYAARELFDSSPEPDSPEWDRWRDLLRKAREANDAYLHHERRMRAQSSNVAGKPQRQEHDAN